MKGKYPIRHKKHGTHTNQIKFAGDLHEKDFVENTKRAEDWTKEQRKK